MNGRRGIQSGMISGLLLVFVIVLTSIISDRDEIGTGASFSAISVPPVARVETLGIMPESDPVVADSLPVRVVAGNDVVPVERERAADISIFTVAVAPLAMATSDRRATVAFEWIQASFLDQLRAIPHLELVVLESAESELTPDDADFYLEVEAESSADPEPVWRYRVNWMATRGESGTWVATDKAAVPARLDTVPRNAAEALRQYPFPPEAGHVIELVARASDVGVDYTQRFEAVDELERIPKRFSLIGRDERTMVAMAAVEIVVSSDDPEVRSRAWRAMANANIDDPYLVAPLVDSLLVDSSELVRFEAVRLLAREFAGNPSVRAAFEYAAVNDLSPEVRTQARWQLLDDQGRREYVADTLQNTDLSDSERLELLSADLQQFHRAVDRQSAMTLAEIARRARPSPEVAAGLPAERFDDGSVSASLVVPLLADLLVNAENEQIRANAASGLIRHVGEPGVRDVLERASRTETSPRVRSQLAYGLSRNQPPLLF